MVYRNSIFFKEKIDIKESLFSGQTFLWNALDIDGEFYATIIGNNIIIIRQLSDYEIEVISSDELINGCIISEFICKYFSVDVDIKSLLSDCFIYRYADIYDKILSFFSVKVLRQDPYETLISFMCAQGIGMHLIRKQVSMIAQAYGEKKSITLSGKEIVLHTFPTPERLSAVDPLLLSACTNNNRIRATNIVLAAQAVADGKIDLKALANPAIPLADLRNTLCQNRGIGFKIADCIALFGLGRFDAFPIDTHVKQYLATWFNSTTALSPLTPARYLLLDAEARTFLNSELAGYAGHILFHCWRKEIKKLRYF
jgi:N-glycosylase/DNA lyase